MQISLKPTRPSDAPVLNEMLQGFLQEAGYYLGSKRQADGNFELPGFTDLGDDARGLYILSVDANVAGFAITSPHVPNSKESVLRAIFVKPDYRRKGVGRELLSALFTKRPGPWSVEVPLAFAPASSFFNATLHQFSKSGVSTSGVREGENSRFARRWLQALPNRLIRRREEAEAMLTTDPFPFERKHHNQRQGVLIAAAICTAFAYPIGMAAKSESLYLYVLVLAAILWLVYLEMVVTSVLDRLDRGPIAPPIWDDKP